MTPEQLAEIQGRHEAPHGHECGKTCWTLAHEDVPALLGAVESLVAAQERVRAEHPRRADQKAGPIPGAYLRPYCGTCMKTYPCPTIRALDEGSDR